MAEIINVIDQSNSTELNIVEDGNPVVQVVQEAGNPIVNIILSGGIVSSGADLNYVHTQQVASTTWVVNHNLNKFASVMVVDTADTGVIGQVHYNSKNQITLTFSAPFSGKAFIN